jgi:hypothetical protein
LGADEVGSRAKTKSSATAVAGRTITTTIGSKIQGDAKLPC